MTNSIWIIIIIIFQGFRVSRIFTNKSIISTDFDDVELTELKMLEPKELIKKLMHLSMVINIVQIISYVFVYSLYPTRLVFAGVVALTIARIYNHYVIKKAFTNYSSNPDTKVILKQIGSNTRPISDAINISELIVFVLTFISVAF